MGGRVAEEIIFGYEKVSSGASSDIKYASKLARAMVTEWGMSDKIGPLFYGSDQQETFLGYGGGAAKNSSEQMANIIDDEVKHFVEAAYIHAKDILTEHLDELHLIAQTLLEYETLTGDEIRGLLKGEAIKRIETEKKMAIKSSLPSSRARKSGSASTEAAPPA
jgi:cell division protease FtsH